MISLVTRLKEMVLEEQQPTFVISVFGNNFVTPAFMRQAEKATIEAIQLIRGMAVTGLTPMQEWILKGFNLFLKKDYKSFRTKEEAMEFLARQT